MKSTTKIINNGAFQSAGYNYLINILGLKVIPNWHISETGGSINKKIVEPNGLTREIFPKSYNPGDNLFNHLEFALKYDGINLAIICQIFDSISEKQLTNWIKSKPQGQYTRRIWYLYEWMKQKQLPIDNLNKGNYVDLLDSNKYYTANNILVNRQRIKDNLLGNRQFCPIVRKTETLWEFEKSDLKNRCNSILSDFSVDILKRVINYLFTKETKSSFAIENIKPDICRTEKFARLLQMAENEDFINKDALIDLQNKIVDPRYADKDYRKNQNYVGQTVAFQREKIHYIPPKPQDVEGLMDGLIQSHKRMVNSSVPSVIHAAAISFGFVFIHPFGDGNGRIHRFLIHNILSRNGFTPKGMIFPISAAMLNNISEYDDTLENFSKPLMPLIDYRLDDDGMVTVNNSTVDFYRYIDMSIISQELYNFIQKTIEKDLIEELNFLQNYDKTKNAIQQIVDMPDQKIDLFIKLCLQNRGLISSKKRQKHFAELNDNEVKLMQQAIVTTNLSSQ